MKKIISALLSSLLLVLLLAGCKTNVDIPVGDNAVPPPGMDEAETALILALGDRYFDNCSLNFSGIAVVNGEDCWMFELGTVTDGKFTAEEHFTVSGSGEIYKMDVLTGKYIPYSPDNINSADDLNPDSPTLTEVECFGEGLDAKFALYVIVLADAFDFQGSYQGSGSVFMEIARFYKGAWHIWDEQSVDLDRVDKTAKAIPFLYPAENMDNNTQFKVRLTYRYTDDSGEHAASSDWSAAMSADSSIYVALPTPLKTRSTASVPLSPDFLEYGTPCFLNEYEVLTTENNPGAVGGASGTDLDSFFAWSAFEDGSGRHCLMILLDAEEQWGAANNCLHIPGYEVPTVSKNSSEINLIWENPANKDDYIHIMFQNGSGVMWVHKNPLGGNTGGYSVEMPVSVYDDGTGSGRFYVPLYAIINELGGGVMDDPFGEGTAFIYTGSDLQGYSGAWEVSDRTEYRVDAEIDDKIVSVGNYFYALELHPDGTFLETDRYYLDEGGWVRIESKGQYAFFGRALAMRHIYYSEYRGAEFNNLTPVKVDVLYGSDIPGGGVSARYVDSWDYEDILCMRRYDVLYSKTLAGREW